MEFAKVLFVIIEALVSLLLIGIILLQKSKSEGLGMAFGAGMGESLFGARAGNVLTKATIVLGVIFLANTLFLGVLFAKKTESTASNLAKLAAVEAGTVQAEPIVGETTTPILDVSSEIPAGSVEIPVVEQAVAVEVPAEASKPVAEEK